MKIKIDSQIHIQDPEERIIRYCKENLILKNPKFYQLRRMGKWTGKEPERIELYSVEYQKGHEIYHLPFGCLRNIWRLTNQKEIFECLFPEEKNVTYFPKIKLREYQLAIPEAIARYKNGIIVSPCGSGKTIAGLFSAAILKKRVLWVTHTVDLLNQSYQAATMALGLSGDEIGTIASGTYKIGTHMTFATVQTLCNLKNLQELSHKFQMVIVDECHRCCVNANSMGMFEKVLNTINCRYKIGLTATMHRSDGLVKGVCALLGEVIHEVSKESIQENTMPVTIRFQKTEYTYSDEVLDTDGTIIYSKLVNDIVSHYERNKQIAADLLHNKEHYNLVLSDRISHLKALQKLLPENFSSEMIDGKTPKKKREQILKKTREGKIHYLFATYQLAKEGLDIPRLDRLYMGLPKKDYAVTVQSIGRIARQFEQKQDAVCYDYVDNIGICKKMYQERKRAYQKQGYQTNLVILS